MTERVINIAFRIVFHSILDFFRKKISNNAILFIYLFIVAYRWIQENNLFQNQDKKIYQAI
jgi:Flp pilus assembly protein protease CpaA